MTSYNVFANGTFWGVFEAETAKEATQKAAGEVGTDGNIDGLIAEAAEYTQADLDAAAVLMDDEIREDLHDRAYIQTPDQFIAEYRKMHAAKFDGEDFAW